MFNNEEIGWWMGGKGKNKKRRGKKFFSSGAFWLVGEFVLFACSHGIGQYIQYAGTSYYSSSSSSSSSSTMGVICLRVISGYQEKEGRKICYYFITFLTCWFNYDPRNYYGVLQYTIQYLRIADYDSRIGMNSISESELGMDSHNSCLLLLCT